MKRILIADLRSNFIFFVFLIFNFTFGLSGFVSLDAFKNGIQESIKNNAKDYLSADLSISVRRLLTTQEEQTVREELKRLGMGDYQESRTLEMFTMLNTSPERNSQGSLSSTSLPPSQMLVQLKLIDEKYPFYGKLELTKNSLAASLSAREEFHHHGPGIMPMAWTTPEVLTQLGLTLGSTFKVGQLNVVLNDTITLDSTQAMRLSAFAPKVYISINWLKELGLLTTGSTLTESRLYKFNSSRQSAVTPEEVKTNLLKKLVDPAIQVQTPEDAQEDSGRMLGYLNDYLGLVSLVGVFLAMIGSTYLYRSFLNSRVKSMAILNALGLSLRRSVGIYIVQLLIVAFFSAIVSILLSFLITPLIQMVLENFMSVKVDVLFQPKSALLAFLVSILSVLFSGLPYLVTIQRIQTSLLLQESSLLALPLKRWDFFYFLPLLIVFYLLSLYQAHSFKVGSYFFGGLMGSFILIYGFSLILLMMLRKINVEKLPMALKHALLLVTRKASQSLPVIVALAMASLLINLIPQIKKGILEEFSISKEVKVPGLFLFDIQDEQVKPLSEIVLSEGVSLSSLSPMVRARILSVNGEPFEKSMGENSNFKTREDEVEARFRNRGFNLSYRTTLSAAEKVVKGHWNDQVWKEDSKELPEISLEQKFAERLKFKMGDVLMFDVQGLEIQGRVTSFRSVKWNSFQPNFFVLFQSGVLDEAPKTWLASIPQSSALLKNQIQQKIAKTFFNISVIDVESLTHRILNLIHQMSWAIQLMSVISLLAGLFVIYSISKDQSQSRRQDFSLMSILGAPLSFVRQQSFYSSLLLSFFACIVGILFSFGFSYILTFVIFDDLFVPDLLWPVISFIIVVGFTVLISYLFILRRQ